MRWGGWRKRMRADVGAVRLEGGVLAELYARHAGDALRLAYLLTGDAALAEDLVQDAFVRLAGRLLHLRDQEGFHAYLRQTIVNLARSHFRRRALERRFIERHAEPPPVAPPDLSDRDRTRQALMKLPIRQRTAVVLRYFEDLSEAQTAQLMRCGLAAVKSLVSRGTTSLRTTLGADR
jgi:RNA polymerase sigma-70 factor (sigma-E family)